MGEAGDRHCRRPRAQRELCVHWVKFPDGRWPPGPSGFPRDEVVGVASYANNANS